MVGRVNTDLMKLVDVDADEETVTYAAMMIEMEINQKFWQQMMNVNMELF